MKTVLLGDVCEFQNGFAFESNFFSQTNGMPLIRIRDIKNGLKTETRYTGPYKNDFVVKKGDYLIGMDGEFRCYVWRGEDALLNQRVCRLRKYRETIDPKFLFYGINEYLEAIEEKTTFTTVKHISIKQIRDIKFPLPDIGEQKRVVKKLDAAFERIDKAIELTQKNFQNSKELFNSSLVNAFKDIRSDYKETKIKEIVIIKPPKKESKNKVADDDLVSFVPMEYLNILTKFFQEKEPRKLRDVYSGYVYFEDGDLIYAKITPCFENGKMGIASGLTNGIGFGSSEFVPIRPNQELVTVDFLFYFFLKPSFRYEGKPRMTGASGHRRLPNEFVENMSISLPSISTQNQITKRLDETSEQTQKLQKLYQQKFDNLHELKKSFLDKAFKGEL